MDLLFGKRNVLCCSKITYVPVTYFLFSKTKRRYFCILKRSWSWVFIGESGRWILIFIGERWHFLVRKCERLYFLVVFNEFYHFLKNSFKFLVLSFHILYFLFDEIFVLFDFWDCVGICLIDGLSALLKWVVLVNVERWRSKVKILILMKNLYKWGVSELKYGLVLIKLSIEFFDNKFLYFDDFMIVF